jgi:hypothetical protein
MAYRPRILLQSKKAPGVISSFDSPRDTPCFGLLTGSGYEEYITSLFSDASKTVKWMAGLRVDAGTR